MPESPPDNGSPRSSLADIALALGVSRMTVSRALRGLPGVSTKLRERIRLAAEQCGYAPDPIASDTMRRFRQGGRPGDEYRETIAILRLGHGRQHYEPLLAGAASAAMRLGYRIDIIFPEVEGLSPRQVDRILRNRGIRGVIVGPKFSVHNPHYTLDWANLAAVLVDGSFANRGLPRIRGDHMLAGKVAVRNIHRLGYRRPGLILRRRFSEHTRRENVASFLVWSRHEDPDPRKYIWECGYEWELDPAKVRAWIEERQLDCVIGMDDILWERLKLAYGEELTQRLGYVVLHGIDPEISGINVTRMLERMGAEAVRLLDTRLRSGHVGLEPYPATVLVTPEWQAGKTAPPRHG